MNLPVASCLVCGEEKELAVWVDPAITGGSFHGVCFQCRQAAQQMRAGGQGLSPLARKEVQEIVMSALATGSV